MKDRIQYGYDRASNRTWRKNLVAPENQDQHYLYDPLYQVTAAARGNLNLNQTAIGGIPAQRQTFDYDPTGNWDRYTTAEEGVQVLNQTRIHNQANQIVQIDGSNTGLLYDRAGNATQMPPDASGDWSEHYKLTWDAWNRLVKVENQEEEEMASYAYDGRMRRTTKTVDEEVTHAYYNEKWKAVEERVDDSEDPHLQYLWGARPNHRDELVRRDRDADDSGSLEEKLYCLMDYFDTTSVTDEEGNVQERYQFSAFGLRAIMDASWSPQETSAFGFEFGFHGQILDANTNYYDYGYRYFSPRLGRWLSKDPIEERGDKELYLFVSNSPQNGVDYLGLIDIGSYFNGNDFWNIPVDSDKVRFSAKKDCPSNQCWKWSVGNITAISIGTGGREFVSLKGTISPASGAGCCYSMGVMLSNVHWLEYSGIQAGYSDPRAFFSVSGLAGFEFTSTCSRIEDLKSSGTVFSAIAATLVGPSVTVIESNWFIKKYSSWHSWPSVGASISASFGAWTVTSSPLDTTWLPDNAWETFYRY
ncbi:MAG: RHS repeat domain-containing protein [Verrucomicrobiales bacterium]